MSNDDKQKSKLSNSTSSQQNVNVPTFLFLYFLIGFWITTHAIQREILFADLYKYILVLNILGVNVGLQCLIFYRLFIRQQKNKNFMEDSNCDNNKLEDMAQQERTSESARLVSPNTAAKPSYLNLLNNLCAVIFLGIITYCSFVDGVSLFSFHPLLMSLGVSCFRCIISIIYASIS